MKKKNTAVYFLLILLVVVLGSCTSNPVVWDDSYPESKLATVSFNNMTVTSYNGIGVEKWKTVKFPEGNTSIGADVNIFRAGLVFKAAGMEFSYNFEAGKEYRIMGAAENMKWGVRIYNGLSTTGMNSDQDFIAFIAFKNQPTFTK